MAGEKSRGPNAVQYRGFLRSAMIIVQNETVRGLYKGISVVVLFNYSLLLFLVLL